MLDLPGYAPAAAFFAFWILIGGICPEWWPFRKWPWPPPPPPWFRLVSVLTAVVGGAVFTSLAGGGSAQPASPLLEFAATGVFAFVGAAAGLAIAGQFVGAPQDAGAVPAGAAFRQ